MEQAREIIITMLQCIIGCRTKGQQSSAFLNSFFHHKQPLKPSTPTDMSHRKSFPGISLMYLSHTFL